MLHTNRTKWIFAGEQLILVLLTWVRFNDFRFDCREEVAKELRSALSHIKLSSEGVYVQASTLGSLEALLEFLRTSKIPVSLVTSIQSLN